jgi:hypothetical protein
MVTSGQNCLATSLSLTKVATVQRRISAAGFHGGGGQEEEKGESWSTWLQEHARTTVVGEAEHRGGHERRSGVARAAG